MLTEKGFLGPIGDDLPSLIPLTFALIIFFATFTFSLNSFEQKNALISDDMDTLKIARIMRSQSYISSYGEFSALCDKAEVIVTGLRFEAGLVEYNLDPQAPYGLNILDLQYYSDSEGNKFYCTNLQSGENPLSRQLMLNTRVITRVYPLILERGSRHILIPMQLVVVVWEP